ncbi:hypothetical protein CKN94_04155 [Carnobacterium maltaromaticum]|nr:hypothetical protein CKN94_04155 [Carnobacterium maltaromaticum]
MKKYKNILATYKKMSIVYLISGILISWLSAVTIFYFQKIIDSSSLLVVDKCSDPQKLDFLQSRFFYSVFYAVKLIFFLN